MRLKIADKQFTIDDVEKYHLCLQISTSNYLLAVFDTQTDTCIYYEIHEFTSRLNYNEVVYVLDGLVRNHPCLKADNWKNVTVIAVNSKYALSPSDLIEPEDFKDFLTFNTEINFSDEQVLSKNHPVIRTENVFAVSKALIEWIEHHFPTLTVNFIHFTSAFLEVIKRERRNQFADIYALSLENTLTICRYTEEGLMFLNTFRYETEKDFLYYILSVLDELKIERSKAVVKVWGDVKGIDEDVLEFVQQYVGNIQKAKKPEDLNYSSEFENSPIASKENIEIFGAYLLTK